MATRSENLNSAILMGGSMVAFGLNDTFMKSLSAHLPLFQALFLRSCLVCLCLGTMAMLRNIPLLPPRGRDGRMVAWRAVAEATVGVCFVGAYFNMPIANATAILQANPLAITLAGAVFLGERVGWRRWLAILAGFLGVLLIIRPGSDGFTIFSLLALAAVIGVAVRDLLVRFTSNAVHSLTIAFCGGLGVLVVTAVGATTADWRPLPPVAVFQLCGAVLSLMTAYQLAVAAMRSGDIGAVAPVRYTNLLVAMFAGVVVFGESLDWPMLAGSAIVVLSGSFNLLREARATRRKKPG